MVTPTCNPSTEEAGESPQVQGWFRWPRETSFKKAKVLGARTEQTKRSCRDRSMAARVEMARHSQCAWPLQGPLLCTPRASASLWPLLACYYFVLEYPNNPPLRSVKIHAFCWWWSFWVDVRDEDIKDSLAFFLFLKAGSPISLTRLELTLYPKKQNRFDFWSSCLHFPRASLTCVWRGLWFIWC